MKKVLPNFPYLSQRDNYLNPSGACNVTSIAMALRYLKFAGTGDGQLEDQLYRKCEELGISRHAAHDLKFLAETFPGVSDYYFEDANLSTIRTAIDNNQPCVLHTYLTGFGHIIAIYGYDANGFYVCDPWGDWTRNGYADVRTHGYYSNRLIACSAGAWSNGEFLEMYDSNPTTKKLESIAGMWLHRIARKQ